MAMENPEDKVAHWKALLSAIIIRWLGSAHRSGVPSRLQQGIGVAVDSWEQIAPVIAMVRGLYLYSLGRSSPPSAGTFEPRGFPSGHDSGPRRGSTSLVIIIFPGVGFSPALHNYFRGKLQQESPGWSNGPC